MSRGGGGDGKFFFAPLRRDGSCFYSVARTFDSERAAQAGTWTALFIMPSSPLHPRSGGLMYNYGLHVPQALYPWAIRSSRAILTFWRLASLMEATPEQSGRWNFLELVLST